MKFQASFLALLQTNLLDSNSKPTKILKLLKHEI